MSLRSKYFHNQIGMTSIIIIANLLFLSQWKLVQGLTTPQLPIFGIGALFRPRNMVFRPTLGDDTDLVDSANFFTKAFWAGKTGGADELSSTQSRSLSRQQIAEFRKRYGAAVSSRDRRSELFICQNSKTGEVMGCAGVEVCRVETPNGKSVQTPSPLMSNLAVGKKYRRKGIAEDLVRAVENLVRKEWGYDDCYLFVEKRNAPGVKLYRKLGYRVEWTDETATTLVPRANGSMSTSPTILLSMKKPLGGGLGYAIRSILPFG